jgi:hypothetical protein
MASIKSLLATFALMVLAGCGGGGGGGTSAVTTSSETFQLRAAYVNYLTDTRSATFTVSGTVEGINVTGNGTATQGALSNTTFEGQAALQKVSIITGTLRADGQTVPLSASSTTYVDSNYNPLGSSSTDYEVVTGSVNIPATAKVNDTGVWYSSTRYSSSAKTTRRGTASVSFVMEPDTASTSLLKIIRIEKDTLGTTTSTSAITFRMTPGGSLTRISETDVSPGGTALTITY